MAGKDYPAKPAKGRRKTPRQQILDVPVQTVAGAYIAEARRKSATSHVSAAHAVRKLAQLLGYPASADVRYVRTAALGGQHFQIVEVQP